MKETNCRKCLRPVYHFPYFGGNTFTFFNFTAAHGRRYKPDKSYQMIKTCPPMSIISVKKVMTLVYPNSKRMKKGLGLLGLYEANCVCIFITTRAFALHLLQYFVKPLRLLSFPTITLLPATWF